MPTKRCIYCGRSKPMNKFVRDTNYPDGRRNHCKERACHHAYLEDRYGWDISQSWYLNPVDTVVWEMRVDEMLYGQRAS